MPDEDIDIFEDDTTQKESNEQIKRRRTRELSDIRKVLSIPEGRRFIWRMWGVTGTFRAAYSPKDTNHTMWREGQRSIGMELLGDINEASPMAFSQMKNEFMSESLKEKKEMDDEK